MRENRYSDDDSLPELPDDLSQFAESLASFRPRSMDLNRDQLMFEAGMAAGRGETVITANSFRRTVRAWQSAALILTAVSAGLGTMVAFRPEAESRIVIEEREKPAIHPDSSPAPTETVAGAVTIRTTVPNQESDVVESPSGDLAETNQRSPQAFEGLQLRQHLIAQAFEVQFGADRPPKEVDAPNDSTDRSSTNPPLTPRSLLLGDRSRNRINLLIGESQL